jgi:hypothetical protein
MLIEMHVLIIDGVKYILLTPKDEEKEFHPMVKEHSKEIFGEDSIYFDLKYKLRSKSGIAAIPDAYVINLSKPSEWYIIENELASHEVYDHIVPQVSKFVDSIEELETQKSIVDALDNEINQNKVLKEHIEKMTGQDTFRFLSKLISRPPRIVIVINEVVPEIERANKSLKRLANTEIVEFRTFVREDGSNVHAHLFEPLSILESTAKEEKRSVAAGKAWETRKSQVRIPVEEQFEKIGNIQAREIARKLRDEIKKISENIVERTTIDHITFWVSNSKFSSVYPEKNGFCFEVKIPSNQFGIKNLYVTKAQTAPNWSFIHVNEKTDLNLLVEAAKQAYERAKK